MHPQVTHNFLDPVIAQIAVTAVQLQAIIGDLAACLGHEFLGHCAMGAGIGRALVELPCSLAQEHAGGLQLNLHISEAKLQRLELVNGFAGKNLMLARGPQYLYENVRDFIVAVTEGPTVRETNRSDHQPDYRPGRIIACASLHVLWEDVAEIRSTAIRPGYQNKGLGKKLIDFLKIDARHLGVKTLFTFTLADDFFKALGFVRKKREDLPPKVWGECSRCPKFFKCDEVGMILKI